MICERHFSRFNRLIMLLCGCIQNGHSIAATAVNFFKSFEFLRKTLFSSDDGGTIALFDSGNQLGDEGVLLWKKAFAIRLWKQLKRLIRIEVAFLRILQKFLKIYARVAIESAK
jgi:hypothetical protein